VPIQADTSYGQPGAHTGSSKLLRYLLAGAGIGSILEGVWKFHDHFVSKYDLGLRPGGYVDTDFLLSYVCIFGGALLVLFATKKITFPKLQQILLYSLPASFFTLGCYKIATKIYDRSYNAYDILLSLVAIFLGLALIEITRYGSKKKGDSITVAQQQ
jgi:hypothetical protein